MRLEKTFRNHRLIPEKTAELIALRNGKWQLYQEEESESITFLGKEIRLRSGLTFTPYANPTRCNAHCRFCSEELMRKHQKQLTAKNIIENYDQYFLGLTRALEQLAPMENIGLSLSGLEATSDPMWLLQLLALINRNGNITLFNEKVLYTNSSGLYNYPDLVQELVNTSFSRLEISRCHYDDEVNQKIMFFNRNEPVYRNEHFEGLLKDLVDLLPVKSSCILTQRGINNISEVEKYLDWVRGLGVKQVVFRELSRLDDTYLNSPTKTWVEENRVPIESILVEVMKALHNTRRGWEFQYSRAGYYYYNEYYTYKNDLEVIMETSSYTALNHSSSSDVVQKLVFHSNGNLCGGWDPDKDVIANYFKKTASTQVLNL